MSPTKFGFDFVAQVEKVSDLNRVITSYNRRIILVFK
jgi:hypothetical protein